MHRDVLREDVEDLYENAPCGYLSLRPDGRIVKANATLAAWTGYAKEQLAGMRFRDLLTIGTAIFYETNFAPVLIADGRIDEMSFDLRTATGAAIAILASGVVATDAAGNPHGTRMVLLKAAARRTYERQLVEAQRLSREMETATQRLLQSERETSELREQFIAVLGHDLRNPLTSITSGARMLMKDPAPERRMLITGLMQSSALRMSGLIDNVMDFARGRLGGGVPLELRPAVALAPVLEQVVNELRQGMPDRVIEEKFDLSAPVVCDPSRIGQLVSNLVGNALSHGSPDQPVRIQASDDQDVLIIWVSNGGEAIPKAAMERLFHPFFRGAVRPSQQGLGLGLHIASEIAKAHGGTLTVVSSATETRFTFTMPLAAGA